jgi:hypothetical protein
MVQTVNPNMQLLEDALVRLDKLADELVFVGGSATGLLLTDPAAPPIRATIDVDVIVEVLSVAGYHRFTQRLKKRGFVEDTRREAPICRWRSGGTVLDVMPTDPSILGFGNIWFAQAFKSAHEIQLPSGKRLRLLPAEIFLATKLEAYNDRGKGDFLLSRDMQDAVSVVDGRPEIVGEVKAAEAKLKGYISDQFSALLKNPDFIDTLPGHLPPDPASQSRLRIILERMKSILM